MGKFGTFVAGGLFGAALALLYAPRTGDETRAFVGEKANEIWKDAQEWGNQAQINAERAYQDAANRSADFARSAQQSATDFARTAQQRGQEFYGAASDRVRTTAEGVRPVIADSSEELRSMIDAARERIASQVVRNAEESQAASREIPIEGDEDEYVPAWARSAQTQEQSRED
ncbi:MAG: YtxH domain-containing protein [Eggerthellaceae bacterium]